MTAVWKTELILNRRGRGLPFDSDRMHRLLTRATDGTDFLWAHPRAGVLLIQSGRPIAPEFFRREAVSVRAKEVELDFASTDRVEIAGILCPTKAERREGRHSRKIALPVDDVPAWLSRRLRPAAAVDTITVENMSPSTGSRADGSRILHARVAVHCWATVVDPQALTNLAVAGLGPGKRFGCGMLTIRQGSGVAS